MLLKQPYIGPKSIIFEVISVVIPVISVNRRTGYGPVYEFTEAEIERWPGVCPLNYQASK